MAGECGATSACAQSQRRSTLQRGERMQTRARRAGGRMVKWLEEITVTEGESDNFYHFHDNRVLPSHVNEVLAKAEGARPRAPRALPARCGGVCAGNLPGPTPKQMRARPPLYRARGGAGWWFRPEYIINDININSVVSSPAHDEARQLSGRADDGFQHAFCACY